MLYSASRRTDMPAFYPEAIVGKVRRSRKLEGLALWTKDIRNLFRHAQLRDVIATVPTLVQYTVTGLAGTPWEPRVPAITAQLEDLKRVADILPAGAIRWRFDPILPDAGFLGRFLTVKAALESALGELDGVTVSFLDPYRHAVRRAQRAGMNWPKTDKAEKRRIVGALANAFPVPDGTDAASFRPIRLCCEPELLELPGATEACCIDARAFTRLYGLELPTIVRDPGQRAACQCAKSTDIGAYAMHCGHGCLYCYASPEPDQLL